MYTYLQARLIALRRGLQLRLSVASHVHSMPARHEQSAQQLQSHRRPAEYYIDEKWDRCIDLTLRRVTYSSLAAGAIALVFLSEYVHVRLHSILCNCGFPSPRL